MKRILFLADVNSAHTHKWVVSLAGKGFSIGIFSLSIPESDWWKRKNISVFSDEIKKETFSSSSISKISYLKVVSKVKKIIKEFKPDILHAHYATSYGLIGARTKFHPYIISCWGSDVMDFPKKSFIHKFLLKKNLSVADKILATSPTLVKHLKEIIDSEIIITPFGIDTEIFKPMKVKSLFGEKDIVIGTIKSLEKIYCIDVLIKAFAEVRHKHVHLSLKLLIVGEGTQKKELKKLAENLKLTYDIVFTDKIDYDEVPKYHNMIDIFVNISERESFGVSVLEAMACGKAVIVSNIDALMNLVKQNGNEVIVETKNIMQTANAIEKLVLDKFLRQSLGNEARKKVQTDYNLGKNISEIVQVYNSVLK